MSNIKKSLNLVFLLLLPVTGIEAREQKSYQLPRTQTIPIQDTQSGRQYELYIKLPEGYSENKEAVNPVIYFTDAVLHIEILSASTDFLMEDAILVGISYQKDIKEDLKEEVGEHVSRYRDYSIRKSNNPERQAKYHFGQASNHLAFIRNDVIKYIEKNYRADPERRTYFGYSLGGLFGAYILMVQPDTFKNYILGSPSLQRDNPYLSELGSNTASKGGSLNANVFISYGALEKNLSKGVETFITMLMAKNDESLTLERVVIDSADHGTAFPMTGVRSVTWLSNLAKNRK